MRSELLVPGSTPDIKLTGQRLYLRPVVPADATLSYVSWLNDPDTTRYLESGQKVETVDTIIAYIQCLQNRSDVLFLAIVLKDGDLHVGNIKLEPINLRHYNAVMGIMIGAPEARYQGIGTEAILLLLRYCFTTLKLHRVELGVTADNLPAIGCYRKIGFQEEGRLREVVRRDHGFVDSLLMAMLEDDFLRRYGA